MGLTTNEPAASAMPRKLGSGLRKQRLESSSVQEPTNSLRQRKRKVEPLTRASSRIPLRGLALRLPVRPILYGVGLGASVFSSRSSGGRARHDGVDLLGILGVLAIVRVTALLPASFVPWRAGMAGWIRDRVLELRDHLRHNVGIDLRGDSRVEARSVPAFRAASGVGWGLLAIAFALRSFFPIEPESCC